MPTLCLLIREWSHWIEFGKLKEYIIYEETEIIC